MHFHVLQILLPIFNKGLHLKPPSKNSLSFNLSNMLAILGMITLWKKNQGFFQFSFNVIRLKDKELVHN